MVAGHVAALTLAHERALSLYPDARSAVRSQYWMLAVMVGFTTLALWLLAAARDEAGAGCWRRLLAALAAGCGEDSERRRRALGPARGLLQEAALRQLARARPEERRVPAHHQPRLLSHRSGDRQRAARAGHDRGRRQARHRGHVPRARTSTTAGELVGSGHPDQRTLPQYLGYLRSEDGGTHLEGGLPARRTPTCTRSSSSTAGSTPGTRCSARWSSPRTAAAASSSTSRRGG